MTYWGEFRSHWSSLLGATLGVALGSALNHYMTNLFAPQLLREFGWARSQFALVGTLGLVTMIFVPFAGRLADRFGARAAATVGFVGLPFCFFGYSLMTGPIWQFFALTVVQHIVGVLTTTLVFNRVVVERFDLARGMGLSLLMTGAPLAGAVLTPIMGEYIDSDGWRAGYRLMALISAAGGIAAVALVGRRRRPEPGPSDLASAARQNGMTRAEFGTLLRHPSFILIIAGMFFCNFPQVIVSSQLKLLLGDNGVTSSLATWLVSLYAGGVIVGRFLSGIALDKVSPQLVAMVALGLPAVGFIALASPLDAPWLLTGSILLIGLAQGAEGDVGAYLISRTFDMRHFSFTYSFLIASMGVAMAVGSVALSFTLRVTESFNLFLILAAALTVVGAFCFIMTGRRPPPVLEAAPSLA